LAHLNVQQSESLTQNAPFSTHPLWGACGLVAPGLELFAQATTASNPMSRTPAA
jgi:hypothetical protein